MKNERYLRLIDANANRCSEGLRVIEDTARFVFENKKVYLNIRSLRHKISILTKEIYPKLLQNRDSTHDSGRKIKESARQNIEAVVRSNFKRVQESLRVLEEYSKLISAQVGAEFKSIRFRVYVLEKRWNELGKKNKY